MTRLVGSHAVRLAVAVALTAYLLWQHDLSAIAGAAVRADWRWVAIACGLVLVDRTLMAVRWILLLRPVTTAPVPLAALLRVFFVSSFVGTFLPAGIGGDAARAYGVTRHDVAASAAVVSVAVDRALGVIGLLLVGFLSALAFDSAVPAGVWWVLAIGGIASLLLAAVVYSDTAGAAATGSVALVPGERLPRAAGRILAALRSYRHHPGVLTAVLAGSVGVQILRTLQAWALGRSLGLDVPIGVYFVAIPMCVLVMQIPVTINGLGTGQAAFLWTFGPSGVARPDALALSLLFVALGLVGNLPGGLLYATGGGSGAGAGAGGQPRSAGTGSSDNASRISRIT